MGKKSGGFLRLRTRKGQSMTVEEVMLIAISIIVLIGIYSSFTFMKTQVSYKTQNRYGDEILNYIIAHAEKLAYSNATYGYILVEIPESLGEEYYKISGGENKGELLLRFDNGRRILKEMNIDIDGIYGFSSSTDKWTMISYNGTSIILRGVNE